MKVIELTIRDVLKVSAIKLFPEGNAVVIGGKNGAGKSSVIRSMWMALGGSDFVPDEPIHRGAQDGEIEVKLDDIIVTRRFSTKTGTSLKVTTRDGSPISSPQKLLDTLVSNMTFDPTEFARYFDDADGREKAAKIVRQLAGIQTEALDVEYKRIYEARRAANQRADTSKGKLQAYPPENFVGVPDVETSAAQIAEQLNKVRESNAKIREEVKRIGTMRLQRTGFAEELEEQKQKVLALEQELETAKRHVTDTEAMIQVRDKELEGIVEPQEADESQFTTQIQEAEQMNQKVRQKGRRAEIVADLDKATKESSELTKRLEAIDAEKEAMVKNAKFPISSISVNDSGVLLNGFPFDQASTAEQLRASLAMAMALHPKLKVIFIRAGNDLDEDSMKLVVQSAEEHGFQVWIERVGAGPEVSFVIEDGKLKE